MKKDSSSKKKAKPSPGLKAPETGRRIRSPYSGEVFVAACALTLTVLMFRAGSSAMEFFGGFLAITLLLIVFVKDIERYKPAFMENPRNLLLTGLLLSVNLFLGRLFLLMLEGFARGMEFLHPDAVIYGLPLATGAMLAALLVDVHLAIVIATLTSLISALWLQDFSYPIFTFVGSITGAFMISQCRKRSAVLRGGLFVSLASLPAGLGMVFLKGTLYSPVGYSTIAFSLINGVAVASMVSILLPMIESAFKMTSDIRLVELLDLNQPLLRNLLLQAPGTYHHSIIVGNLAEAAAETVGANPLLARVSAYYHDIGKAKMPDYFIENQQSAPNRHEKLATTMSSLIISSHVKEGVEMARSHKLPEPIIDIIREHHGTSLMTYFHEKAKSLHEPGTPPVSEADYRYPGPKPQTRVSAVIMLADAVEAASRVLTDPTPARITALVDKITNKIFLDGQLDDCELTLKDLQKIKEHFTYILTSIFHRRIDYPGMSIDDQDKQQPEVPADTLGGPGPESTKGSRPLRVIKG